MKNVNKNDNIKRSSMHLNQGYFLSKQWGEAHLAVFGAYWEARGLELIS